MRFKDQFMFLNPSPFARSVMNLLFHHLWQMSSESFIQYFTKYIVKKQEKNKLRQNTKKIKKKNTNQ